MYLIRTDDSHYAAVVIAADYQNPLQELPSVMDELRKKEVSGEILFDLLFSNGTEWNRFASMQFNGHAFERKTFRVIDSDNMPCSLLKVHGELLNKQDCIQLSVLS
ncbi:type II toxin-antitoxin system RnlB family antitoxin [Aeromonas sobria]|nr:type II toxin-antitoxin system RnlB family antitoxin [Aeromonas sobria]